MWRSICFATARSVTSFARKHVRTVCAEPLSPRQVNTVIYHKNCTDGFGAAFSAWKVLGDNAVYVPATHQTKLPDIAGRDVAICDFSYPRPQMEELLNSAKSLILLDHHVSAMADLHDLPNMHFDMNRSGAMMAWNYFHPDTPPPRLLRYIQDKDLWIWKEPHSTAFSAGFDEVPMVFEEYAKYLDDAMVDRCIERGQVVLNYQSNLIQRGIKSSTTKTWQGMRATIMNCNTLISETGNAVLVLRPDVDIAVMWSYSYPSQSWSVSMRSRVGGCDVSAIAKSFGGGGHAAAASFMWEGSDILSLFAKQKSPAADDTAATSENR